ncbi:MAG TPA: peptidylprolyl isomerase [Azoarcus sp.]|nr:peptidylprolyl isomerase [Azoarcus sp.]
MSQPTMQRFLSFSLLLIALFASGATFAQRAIPADRIVAVVNDEVITALQLREEVTRIAGQLSQQGVELPPRRVLEEQVLDRMIIERAQIQLAKENGLRVDEATLDRAIARIRDNNALTEEELQEVLQRDGISWRQFREGVRNEILISRVREREVDGQITVTDAEIDNFLVSRPEQTGPREVLVSHILLRLPSGASDSEVAAQEAQANEILERHAAGENFERLAVTFSDAPDATAGGLLEWRAPESLPALFADAVVGMSKGQVSEVLRSSAGLHLVKLLDERGGSAGQTVRQTNARHILIRATEVLSDSEVEARMHALRERIVVGGESFEELARVHSDDLSGAQGGDLGWVLPGDTVPEFERAMDILAPGEVSEPVRSPFGWHLIQVIERRNQDVSGELRRAEARNALRERKSQEAYESWLLELRDSTYVDNRLDWE